MRNCAGGAGHTEAAPAFCRLEEQTDGANGGMYYAMRDTSPSFSKPERRTDRLTSAGVGLTGKI
jgi:hypothetical protein